MILMVHCNVDLQVLNSKFELKVREENDKSTRQIFSGQVANGVARDLDAGYRAAGLRVI